MPKITALFYVKNHNINQKLLKTIIKAEELTQYNNNAIFNFAFNYGSRAEITETVRRIVRQKLNIDEISMTTISQNLWTAGLPDVDILIRTGKEKRLSNFMIWQCAYAKIHFLDKYWLDITRNDIEQIVKKFNDDICNKFVLSKSQIL